MNEINEITNQILKFRNERNWEQFHNPKDLAIAISIESNELLENYLWKTSEEANIESVKKEIADIFAFGFLLANYYKLDLKQIIQDKIKENSR